MRNFRKIVVASAILCGFATLVEAAKDDAKLEYQFRGANRFYYRLTEKIEDESGASATIAYFGFEPKVYQAEVGLKYAASMSTQPMTAGGLMPDITPNPNLFDKDWQNRVRISHLGVVLGNSTRQDTSLPGAIAENWQMALPELGTKGQSSWQSTRTIGVVLRGFSRFTPMMRFGPKPSKATIVNNYTLAAAAAGQDANTQSIDFTTSLDTQANGTTSEHTSGNGSFVFDLQRGLVQSLTEKLSATVSIEHKDIHAAITIDLQVLEQGQVDQLIADAKSQPNDMQDLESRVAARRARAATNPAASGAVARESDRQWMDSLELPAGTQHTDFVGTANGGMPFVDAGDGGRPMIGLKYRLGSWAGHSVIGKVEPLYDKPDDMNPKGESIVLAKEGYVVGGFWANNADGTAALRAIFMRKTDTGVNMKDAYVSPWMGQPHNGSRIKLGCNGQFAVGVFGRQGMNTNTFGLVMNGVAGSKTGDPTDDPNYAGSNATGKPGN